MWTNDASALGVADDHFCALLGVTALRSEARFYTRSVEPVRWAEGLAKDLFDVHYVGWEPSFLCHLSWDVRTQRVIDWETAALPRPLQGWPHPDPEADVRDPVLGARLVAEVESRIQTAVRVERLAAIPAGVSPDTQAFEADVWSTIPGEQILIRMNADTGDLMGWRHAAWFCRSEPADVPAKEEEELRSGVETLTLFPKDMRRADGWLSTDRPGHYELLWERSEAGETVENDTFYACVNRFTGRVAECVNNWSTLAPELDLDAGAARAVLAKAYAAHFPDAIRCGALRRMYVEIPGQSVKPRAWVANAIDASGPVQIAVGNGGEVLRVDSVT